MRGTTFEISSPDLITAQIANGELLCPSESWMDWDHDGRGGRLGLQGAALHTLNGGHACHVERFVGEGGQGAVYAVSVPRLGAGRYALKWYHPGKADRGQWERLIDLIERDPPHPRFLWPLDLVTGPDAGFGYLMPFRDESYVGLADLVTGHVDADLRQLATLGMELAESFLYLHNAGLCYCDISFGNVFFRPGTGSVLICDNDNVTINETSASSVSGTPYFMAPEIVRGEAAPSTATDLYSLSVLLFYLFFVHHPLEGRREREFQSWDEAQIEMFGSKPVFIFDPKDTSNAAVPGEHDNALVCWPLYPHYLRDLFTAAFTHGLSDPRNGRVRESVWRATMVRLRDGLVYCSTCGKFNCADPSEPPPVCWSCSTPVTLPMVLNVGGCTVMLNHDARIYSHHLRTDYDFSAPIAEVTPHPERAEVWGLRNLSGFVWTVTSADGTTRSSVEPGRAALIAPGTRIGFGSVPGRIVTPTVGTRAAPTRPLDYHALHG